MAKRNPQHANSRNEPENLLADSRQAQIEALLQHPIRNERERQRIGGKLLLLKAYAQAMPYLVKALDNTPHDTRLAAGLASAYFGLNDYQQALPLLERVLSEAPTLNIRVLHAMTLLGLERVDEAMALFTAAAEQAEHDESLTMETLLTLSRYVPLNQVHRSRIEAVLDANQVDEQARIAAYQTLGKIALDEGQIQQAFAFYQQGNQLHFSSQQESGIPWHKTLGHIQSVYPKALFEAFEHASTDTIPELFIVGPSRSGKSLIEQLLCQHPQVRAGGERAEFFDLMREAAASSNSLNRFVDGLTPDDLPALRYQYIRHMDPANEVVTNTHPDNFFILGMVGLLFPKVPLIFCMRNLLDLGVASYFKNYDIGYHHSYDLETLGRYIGTYEKAMEHWANVLPNPIFVVEYSELVSRPDEIAQSLYAALGLGEYQPDLRKIERTSQLLGQLGPAHSVDLPVRIHNNFEGLGAKLFDELAPLMKGYQAAAEEVSPIILAQQQRLVALYQQLHTLQQAGEYFAMVGVAGRLCELDPEAAAPFALLGTGLSHSGRHQEALKALKKARALAPDDQNIATQEIEALLRLGQYHEAYEKLSHWPDHSIHKPRLVLQAFVGRHHNSLLNGQPAVLTDDELAQCHTHATAVAHLPKDPTLAALLAALSALEGNSEALDQHKRALGQLRSLPRSDVNNDTRRAREEAQLQLLTASSALQLGKLPEGLAALEAVFSLYPVSVSTSQAWQLYRTWLPCSENEQQRALATLHNAIAEQIPTEENLQLPGHAWPKAHLPGERATEERLTAYKLGRHLRRLRKQRPQLYGLELGNSYGFLLLSLRDALHSGLCLAPPPAHWVGEPLASMLNASHIAFAEGDLETLFTAGAPSQRFDLIVAGDEFRSLSSVHILAEQLYTLLNEQGVLLLESHGLKRLSVSERNFEGRVATFKAKGFSILEKGELSDDGVNSRKFALLQKSG